MRKAIELAKEAYDDDEVPVGAVIVRNDEIVELTIEMSEKK